MNASQGRHARPDGHAVQGASATRSASRRRSNSPHYKTPLEGPNRGRGVASGFWFNVGLRSSVNVSVQPDGTVNLIEGNTDIGGTRASLAMQLAETLGIAYEDVKPTVVDTDSVGVQRRHRRQPHDLRAPAWPCTKPART